MAGCVSSLSLLLSDYILILSLRGVSSGRSGRVLTTRAHSPTYALAIIVELGLVLMRPMLNPMLGRRFTAGAIRLFMSRGIVQPFTAIRLIFALW